MPEPHPFRRAAEAKDVELMTETLREDVELHSPILFRGFEGRDVVGQILTHVAATLEDLTYVDELHEGSTVALRFKARVGDRELEGIDFLSSTMRAAWRCSRSSCARCPRSPPSTSRWRSGSASRRASETYSIRSGT